MWKCISDDPRFQDSGFWFKVKGEKHSDTPVKRLVEVDPNKIQNIHEFVENVITDARCRQGIEYLREYGKEVSRKSTGEYLRWIVSDIISEELDTLVASGLEPKDVNKDINVKARNWFFGQIDNGEIS